MPNAYHPTPNAQRLAPHDQAVPNPQPRSQRMPDVDQKLPTMVVMVPNTHAADSKRLPQGSPEVVILGASNVTYGLGTYVSSLTASFDSGVRLWIAHGHGRSFGRKSSAFVRRLEGHVQSRLWTAWDTHADQSSARFALITDVGNDLLYGASVPTILGWVETCLRRLKAKGCEVTIATPPVDAIQSLSRLRYTATAKMFFPKTAVSWDQMQQAVLELDSGLKILAAEGGAAIVEPQPNWYGFDPIHIRRSRRAEAIADLLSRWPSGPPVSVRTARPWKTLHLWQRGPAQKWIAGRLIETPQPVQSDAACELWLY